MEGISRREALAKLGLLAAAFAIPTLAMSDDADARGRKKKHERKHKPRPKVRHKPRRKSHH